MLVELKLERISFFHLSLLWIPFLRLLWTSWLSLPPSETMRFVKLLNGFFILTRTSYHPGARHLLLFRALGRSLWFIWVNLWWCLSCTRWQDSSSVAFCCSSARVSSWSSCAHWVNPHPFPYHFSLNLVTGYSTEALYKRSSVFSHSSFTTYFYRHLIVCTIDIPGLPFSVHEYDRF